VLAVAARVPGKGEYRHSHESTPCLQSSTNAMLNLQSRKRHSPRDQCSYAPDLGEVQSHIAIGFRSWVFYDAGSPRTAFDQLDPRRPPTHAIPPITHVVIDHNSFLRPLVTTVLKIIVRRALA